MKMEQTTSLRTKIFESSLKWRIENFLEYESCKIHEIVSESLKFDEVNAEWSLKIDPRIKTDSAMKTKSIPIRLHVQDNEPRLKQKRLFKAEIRVEPFGHQLMSPANRHLVRAKGFYAEPEMNQPVVETMDFQEINARMIYDGKLEFSGDKFASYLDAGALDIFCNVCVKSVEVIDVVKML